MVTKMSTTKKEWGRMQKSVELPSGVSAKYERNILSVKGAKGEVSKSLKYPRVFVKVEGNKVLIGTEKLTQREKKIVQTYVAHTKNLVKGATEGFTYKLTVVYAKFPITVELKGNDLVVKNLLGEKVPRTLKLPKEVKVEIQASKTIVVTGTDKEITGQAAASIEQLTRITHFDRRVIQDGIYIVEKPHKRYV